jgi:4-hydroxybenzoyl-CoA reductase subunit beta
MILPPFELHRPTTLEELLAVVRELQAKGESFDYMAGGTDVLPNYKNRLNAREHVISLSALEGFDTISPGEIGARALVTSLAEDGQISEHFPGLSQAAQQISSPPLRNMGSVGGNLLLDTRCYYFNQSEFWRASKGYCLKADGDVCLVVPQKEICYATYSGDLAPVFLVLDATMHLAGPEGERSVPMREFYQFDGITRFHKKPDELLTKVTIPSEARQLSTGYKKLRVRDTIEYPVMGVAMGLRVEGDTVADLRVAVTGSEAVPLYYGDLDLNGQPAKPELGDEIEERILERLKTYKNVPFPPGYRRSMGGRFAKSLFEELLAGR